MYKYIVVVIIIINVILQKIDQSTIYE